MTQTTEKRQIKKKQTEKRQTGYVYAVRSYQTDDIYIGSTLGTLRQRLYKHKNDLKQYNNGKYHYVTSFEIVKYDDAFIEMIDKFENVNKIELRKYEGQTIRNTKCVNKRIEGGRNKDEMKEFHKEYKETNKDKLKEQHKEYYETHKEQKKEYQLINKDKIKEYYETNKDIILKKKKEYYETNKDKIKEQRKEYRALMKQKLKTAIFGEMILN